MGDLKCTSSKPSSITAVGPEEAARLLAAVWGDWVDFYFTPHPKRYYLVADHDEYTTIFGAKKGHVSKMATALANPGFSRVDGYEREW